MIRLVLIVWILMQLLVTLELGLDFTVVDSSPHLSTIHTGQFLYTDDLFVSARGKRYSIADHSLVVNAMNRSKQSDCIGQYELRFVQFKSDDLIGVKDMIAEVKIYDRISLNDIDGLPLKARVLIWKLKFPEGLENASIDNDPNSLIAALPCMNYSTRQIFGNKFEKSAGSILYWAPGGYMMGDRNKTFGEFGQMDNVISGIESGPIILRVSQENRQWSLVLSPYSQFMMGQTVYTETNMCMGLMGSIQHLPKQFEAQWVLVETFDTAIMPTVGAWGSLLTRSYGKDRSQQMSDLINNFIGYWTDNGAFYYYNTASKMNYEETMIAVIQNAENLSIPFMYIQYDSWWYPKDNYSGVTEWIAKPGIFPSNLTGLNAKIPLPIVAHNRWWSPSTKYSKNNGGPFDFFVEDTIALPHDQTFWDYLMQQSKLWGLKTYEQDWQNIQFEGMNITLTDPYAAQDWLVQMGKAATKNDLTIQYCMALTKSGLMSLLIPAVTQIRASDDYQPGTNLQWRIGYTSAIAWSLNLAPFKDNFWSSKVQPGNPYDGKEEPFSEVNSIAATLSMGPVALGDKIGCENVSLIMKSCSADGTILKPSRPALAIEEQFLKAAGCTQEGLPEGEVWTTYSQVEGHTFGIIFAAFDEKQNVPYNLTLSSSGLRNVLHKQEYNMLMQHAHSMPSQFSDNSPLQIPPNCTPLHPCLYYTSPLLQTLTANAINASFYFFGELGTKWVPVSSQRFTEIYRDWDDVVIKFTGSMGENITVWAYSTQEERIFSINCTQSAQGGTSSISLKSRTCWDH